MAVEVLSVLPITPTGRLRNDSGKHIELAKRLYAYSNSARAALSFATGKVNSALEVGDIITHIGDVNASINAGVKRLVFTSSMAV